MERSAVLQRLEMAVDPALVSLAVEQAVIHPNQRRRFAMVEIKFDHGFGRQLLGRVDEAQQDIGAIHGAVLKGGCPGDQAIAVSGAVQDAVVKLVDVLDIAQPAAVPLALVGPEQIVGDVVHRNAAGIGFQPDALAVRIGLTVHDRFIQPLDDRVGPRVGTAKAEHFHVGDSVTPIRATIRVSDDRSAVVEADRVVARTADQHQRVVTITAIDDIVAFTTGDGVVTTAAGEAVVADTAGDKIVTVTPVDGGTTDFAVSGSKHAGVREDNLVVACTPDDYDVR